ncbi:MAG TPA: pyridoxine 5'-phosphate synthase [Thermoguttaceae bacterium]|nr:pyridoxine 5'-phosphate synthase [Thermoguttaceae bacterium]
MALLGVNIDHVATVRQARRTNEPDPVWAAALAELGGADGITIHLREDRRHIQDRDLMVLRETVAVKFNLEMACADEIVEIACRVQPRQATIVPERREEVTTEGGLDVLGNRDRVAHVIQRLREVGVVVSLFLAPDLAQILAAGELGADAVELHTGQYALAAPGEGQEKELQTLKKAAAVVLREGMTLHAGHGLTYRNARPIAAIVGMSELNIGHSIIARSIMVGLTEAVREMKRLIA